MSIKLADDASADDIRRLLFTGHGYVRVEFYRNHRDQIDTAIEKIAATYQSYRAFEKKATPHDQRSATVQAFLYTALNSVATSLHLLISGMVAPAGNLMRHYGEASAMALLCSHPTLSDFSDFEKKKGKYPVHDALNRVNKTKARALLDVKGTAWVQFMKLTQFYDQFSHASLLTVASQFLFDKPDLLAFGGEYDSAKAETYNVELGRRATAAGVLQVMIDELAKRLPFTPPSELGQASSVSAT